MRALCLLALVVGIAVPASAQAPDTILINGKIITLDSRSMVAMGLAVTDGRITATGSTDDVRRLAGPSTRVIDLRGRTVIPGLIDSHLHAIRAALSFSTEVNWIGARSIEEGLGRIRAAARAMKPGSWLIVAGGWNVQQFEENRRPTQAELTDVAPNNPVYVQLGYGWAMLNPLAHKALGLTNESDLPQGGRFERDSNGALTGAVTGAQNAIVALFDRLPRPTFAQQIEGTKAFFRELNRLALTGVVDPGGNNLTAPDYEALFKVWRDKAMTVRVAYTLNGQTPGKEFEELRDLTGLLPMGFGDDMLRFNGLGERITVAMNNNNAPSQADKDAYYRIVRWAADRGMSLTMHWGNDASVDHLLSIFERVNAEIPIAPLRWSIAHLNDASDASLRRMKALGVGWTMQDAMYFGGEQFLKQSGPEAAKRTPPVETARKTGVVVGAGTDAHRVASYNPFTALQWLLDSKTVGGVVMRGAEEIPSRIDALKFYTLGSAWFSFDEDKRGSLDVGKLADLAVLSADYLTVPVEKIGSLESVLTMVGGKVVYTSGPFADLDKAH
ncbi:MAG TPA: amidohydrolase [Vicinamibacterales bacterium]|jgi:predicted amidohydrolase YtcJ|nr:amidohydrolase [Vicinamibacterales bacterium]